MQPALNVIEVSSPDVFNLVLYPNSHPGTHQFLLNQFGNISATLMESGQRFMNEGRAVVEQFVSGADRAARASLRMMQGLFNPNTIYAHRTLEDLQAAPPLMQRYLMADPYLRSQYHAQQCSGYAGTYVDPQPGVVGRDHYDYRRVNNGMVRFEGEGDQEQWVATMYAEELRPDDRELSFAEKTLIFDAAAIAGLFMRAGEDPTDPYGGKLD